MGWLSFYSYIIHTSQLSDEHHVLWLRGEGRAYAQLELGEGPLKR